MYAKLKKRETGKLRSCIHNTEKKTLKTLTVQNHKLFYTFMLLRSHALVNYKLLYAGK